MKSIINGRVASLFLVMLFITMGSNPVIALDWEQRCLDPKFADHPNCTDGGDPDSGDGIKTKVANWAAWESEYVYELDSNENPANPRFCGGSDDDIDLSPHPAGWTAYRCDAFPSDNVVFIDLAGIPLVASGPESPLCDRLLDSNNPLAMGEPFSQLGLYNFGLDPNWNDGPCSVDNGMQTCLTRAYTSAIFDECSGKKCGRLVTLEGWGHVLAAESRPGDDLVEHNPFTRPQTMWVEDLTVTFHGIGRDKVVATCFFDNYDESANLFFERIIFNSYLIEP